MSSYITEASIDDKPIEVKTVVAETAA
jgi:hypothetical protein